MALSYILAMGSGVVAVAMFWRQDAYKPRWKVRAVQVASGLLALVISGMILADLPSSYPHPDPGYWIWSYAAVGAGIIILHGLLADIRL